MITLGVLDSDIVETCKDRGDLRLFVRSKGIVSVRTKYILALYRRDKRPSPTRTSWTSDNPLGPNGRGLGPPSDVSSSEGTDRLGCVSGPEDVFL